MTADILALAADRPAAAALEALHQSAAGRDAGQAMFVVDPETCAFRGAVPLLRLMAAEPSARLGDLLGEDAPIFVRPDDDGADAARLMAHHRVAGLPVLGPADTVVGAVALADLVADVLAEEGDDIRRFGATEAGHGPYLRTGFFARLRQRGGWLCLLFLSEMLTASAMQHFNDELQKAVVLTLFIPLIMSSGGNSGSQATSLLIRALALGDMSLRDWWRVALREIPTGLALGAILACLGIVRITLWQELGIYDYGPHWTLVALTVAAGLVGVVTFGSLAGAMLPFLLKRAGFDPASASAPFVATLVDVAGLIIYFSLAMLVLRGTLL
ncbi:magnesium transporter [Jiella sp. M17.18]|uniref:magnesium transporter n=1 Tax=Jiella sp. M17.18 TaxID=3234247 RepID=UPI0034DFEBDC